MEDDARERALFRKIYDGSIPWDVEGYMSAHDFEARLHKTPRDDWDHSPQRVAFDLSAVPTDLKAAARDAFHELENIGLVDVAPGSRDVITATMSSLAHENQVALFIRKHAPDRYIGTAHALRYFEMGYFLKTHRRRLFKDGFMRKTAVPDDPSLGAYEEINDVVLKALCELPYRGQRRQGPSGVVKTFRLSDVLKRAKQLLAEEEHGALPDAP